MTVSDDKKALAVQVVKDYAEAMYRADLQHREECRRIKRQRSITAAEETALLDAAVAEKVAAYEQLWREDDDYWKPCSVDWPSEFNASKFAGLAVAEGVDGQFVVTYRTAILGVGTDEQSNTFTVQFFKDGPKIVAYGYK